MWGWASSAWGGFTALSVPGARCPVPGARCSDQCPKDVSKIVGGVLLEFSTTNRQGTDSSAHDEPHRIYFRDNAFEEQGQPRDRARAWLVSRWRSS
ncbi:hypothetical protein GCM10011588_48910 [Nocardia jinanensis]|uniref:Uncharacterized protein n=1 Tax=Nocardia jinanensis TaxID=382504 RepID=A0A917RTV9_9NOCA|nr:hypothetical protein GCM10011588_48910 [Nocardia jinanensis]